MKVPRLERKAGRPKAIPEENIDDVTSLYCSGLGYRAITRELERKGILVTYSTVRRAIKAAESRKAARKA
jgi:transposase-like protein